MMEKETLVNLTGCDRFTKLQFGARVLNNAILCLKVSQRVGMSDFLKKYQKISLGLFGVRNIENTVGSGGHCY